jgi:long-chain fatty acid transport protein
MMIPFRRTRIAASVCGVALALGAGHAFGTGFQLNENSASSIGNALAGGAAFTDDATAMWWNPAALSSFSRTQGVAAMHVITPKINFSNNATVPAYNQPLGGDGGDAGGNNFVPNMYVAIPINQQFAFGLGVNAPFGLTTEYDDGWMGRYQTLKSSIQTINVNPALSWKVSPQLAIGAGVNYQTIKATLTQNANYSYLMAAYAQGAGIAAGSPTFNAIAQATKGLDAKASITADDGAWGWNVGVAWDVTPALRLAAAYRSEIKYDVNGNVEYTNPTIALAPGTPPQLAGTIAALSAAINQTYTYNRGVGSSITLPQIANLSMHWQIDPKWELMADAQYTGWSSIPELKFNASAPPTIPTVPLEWDDTWKIAVGASYRYNDQWKARAGIAFDQTPVTTHPTPRLPDSDRWWYAIGGEYKATPNWKFDAGFVYIKGDSAEFNQQFGTGTQQASSLGQLRGSYDASVTIFSVQAAYTF